MSWFRRRQAWQPVAVHHIRITFSNSENTIVLYRNERTDEFKTESFHGHWNPKHFGISDEDES